MPMTTLPDPQYDTAFYDGVLPKRLFAWVIDAALIFGTLFVISLFTLGIGFFLWVPLHLALAFFYRWTTITNGGATFGMRVMSIQLVSRRGTPLTRGEAAAHTALFLLGASVLIVQAASIASMLLSDRGRSLGDHVTGAVMLNRAT